MLKWRHATGKRVGKFYVDINYILYSAYSYFILFFVMSLCVCICEDDPCFLEKFTPLNNLPWYKSNYRSGNPSKYQVLVKSRAKQEVKKAVHIDGHTIGQAQEIKLLGVILDVNLQFSEHVKQICTKTSRRIGVLSRLRNLILTTAKLTIYKTAVKPHFLTHFTYCSLDVKYIWNNSFLNCGCRWKWRMIITVNFPM